MIPLILVTSLGVAIGAAAAGEKFIAIAALVAALVAGLAAVGRK